MFLLVVGFLLATQQIYSALSARLLKIEEDYQLRIINLENKIRNLQLISGDLEIEQHRLFKACEKIGITPKEYIARPFED
jgi:hypothetical protein